nr:EH signature domain-containing protein [uncultured Bacteroides sp.]
MSTIKEILSFNFHADYFAHSANTIFAHNQEKTFEFNNRRLDLITEKYQYERDIIVDEKTAEELLKRFNAMFNIYNNEKTIVNTFSLKELKKFCYCINKFKESPSKMEFAAILLDSFWKDNFINGLLSYVLSNWEMGNTDSNNTIRKLLLKHLNNYTGTRKKFVQLKNNKDFLDVSGPLRVGKLIRMKNYPKKEFTNFFNLPENCLSYEYYSKAIITYYEGIYSDLAQLKEILTIHNNITTNKKLLPLFIKYADRNYSEEKQDEMKAIAIAFIGDPGVNSYWAPFENATEIEISNLNDAKKIVNEWLTQRFITVFFEKCFLDPERKRFWLRYAKHINRFKIVGSLLTYRMLESDSRIREALSQRYKKTSSSKRTTSALVMYIQNHIIIEFSETGAVYVYKQGSEISKRIERISIDSTDNLKVPSLSSIVSSNYGYNYFYDEGRLVHMGYWQERMDKWIQSKLNIYI